MFDTCLGVPKRFMHTTQNPSLFFGFKILHTSKKCYMHHEELCHLIANS